jgi:Transcriptional activator of acetoin/glycerol metabolism
MGNSSLNLSSLNLSQKTEVNLTDEFMVEMDSTRWRAVEECKERFLRDGENPYDNPYMYPEIAASWIRSKKYGIDPYAKTLGYNLKPKELAALTRDKHAMIDIAGDFMKKHLGLLASSGYYMCLTDEHGILLFYAGANEKVQVFERINARPGAVWSEETIGTNCHSLCITLKKPVQLIGPYYYCQAVYDNIGSGTPILDENGEVQGVLLVVDAMDSPEKQIKQTHLLGWVVSAGLAIESQLKLRKRSYYLELANRTVETTIEAIGEGCITLDKVGVITHINREGADLFGIDEKTAKGKHYSDLFAVDIPIEKVLEDGETITDYQILINNDLSGQSHSMDIEPIFNDETEAPDGVFIRLNLSATFNKVRTKAKEYNKDSFAPIHGDSKELKDTINKARKLAQHDGGVLLIGDSGTGKELFAHAIHDEARPEGSFIAINCSSLPTNLIESELFGYEGGSFTGAERRGRMGKIELANGGTLFLDEIGDMPLEVQPILLRVLEDKKVMRIGGKKYIPVDFRVIAATNQDLLELVKAKKFRQDLYYRLAVFRLNIPPLRERHDDVLKLANYFIDKYCKLNNTGNLPKLSPAVKEILSAYDWPGNVRQLQNAITYALAMVSEGVIEVEHLPDEIIQSYPLYKRTRVVTNNNQAADTEAKESRIVLDTNMAMTEIEKIVIENTLHATGYNIPHTADILGFARSTLYRKLKEYDINC